jgi:hypothetical protein
MSVTYNNQTYWIGTYGVLVNDKIEQCADSDGVSTLLKNGTKYSLNSEILSSIFENGTKDEITGYYSAPILSEKEWKMKFAVKADDNLWIYINGAPKDLIEKYKHQNIPYINLNFNKNFSFIDNVRKITREKSEINYEADRVKILDAANSGNNIVHFSGDNFYERIKILREEGFNVILYESSNKLHMEFSVSW